MHSMPRIAAFVCSVSLALLTPLVAHAQRPSSIEGQVIAAGGPIDFEHGSPTLTPEAMATLDRVAALLRARAGIRIVDIEVRSDTRGSTLWNLRLTAARAQAIVDYLISRGIEPRRLRAAGLGEAQPPALPGVVLRIAA
jgi:peptidoglycan-associated lipoprotein